MAARFFIQKVLCAAVETTLWSLWRRLAALATGTTNYVVSGWGASTDRADEGERSGRGEIEMWNALSLKKP